MRSCSAMALTSAKSEGTQGESCAFAHTLPRRLAATSSSSSWCLVRSGMGVGRTASTRVMVSCRRRMLSHFRKRQAKCSSLSRSVAKSPIAFASKWSRACSQQPSQAPGRSTNSRGQPHPRVLPQRVALPQAPCSTDSRAKASAAQTRRKWWGASPRLAWHCGSRDARPTALRKASGSANTSRQTMRSCSGRGPRQWLYCALSAGDPRKALRVTSRSR